MEVPARKPEELKRESECPARHQSQCAIINDELGWKHGCPLSDCDKCWAAGGPQSAASPPIRAELTRRYILGVKKNLMSGAISRETFETLLQRHCTPEEAAAARAHPELGWVLDRGKLWDKVKGSWDKADSFMRSLKSRGLANVHVDLTVKGVRRASCFGVNPEGRKVAEPCPSMTSSTQWEGKHFCNACGCGDKELALLDADDYPKIDYPYLECPRGRAGFSNSKLPLVIPLPLEEREGVVFGTQGGVGDLVLHCWHAEWYKKEGISCSFSCGDAGKIEVLKLLGQTVIPDGRGKIVTGGAAQHYHFELKMDKGVNPRAVVWGSQLPYTPGLVQPTATIPEEATLQARKDLEKIREGKKGMVVLFPFAEWHPRIWPLSHWVDLAWILTRRGYGTVCLAPASKEGSIKGFPHFRWGQDWTRVAATMREADLVVGNDSGPAHLAGALGVKTIALMGPTQKVFYHCPTVEELSFTPMACTGCHFQGEKGFRAACDAGCQSLMAMTPTMVADAVEIAMGGDHDASST